MSSFLKYIGTQKEKNGLGFTQSTIKPSGTIKFVLQVDLIELVYKKDFENCEIIKGNKQWTLTSIILKVICKFQAMNNNLL